MSVIKMQISENQKRLLLLTYTFAKSTAYLSPTISEKDLFEKSGMSREVFTIEMKGLTFGDDILILPTLEGLMLATKGHAAVTKFPEVNKLTAAQLEDLLLKRN